MLKKQNIKKLEQRTSVGTEFLQIKKVGNKVFARTSWNKEPRGKWKETKYNTQKEFINRIKNKYKTPVEWKKIESKKHITLKKQIPHINKLEKIDSQIRYLEHNMINGKINSLSESEQNKYHKLKNERRQVSRKID